MLTRNIHDQQILHDRVPQMPIRVAVGKIRRRTQLLRGNATAQHVGPDVGKPGLLLWVNTHVVAVNIGGHFFRPGRIQVEAEAILEGGQKRFRRPSMLQEQKLKPSALAILAKHFRFAKQLRHAAYDGDNLLPLDESVEPNAKMRIGRKPARDAQGKSDLLTIEPLSRNGGEAYIVDFWIRAPGPAAGDGNFELARQIIELRIAAQPAIQLQSQRRSIAIFVRVKTRQGTAGNISRHVPASTGGRQPHAPQRLQYVGQRLNGHPMQLYVLPHGDVRDSTGVPLGEVGDGARLLTAQETVGNSDAHHKEWRRLPLAILAADHAGAVPLGVNAPGTKIGAQPFRRNRSMTLSRKLAYLVKVLPCILCTLEPLDPLRLGFLNFAHVR